MTNMKLKDGMDNWIACRICLLQPSTGLQSIFHKNDEQDLTLLIQECGGIPIKKFDHYPDKICTKCLKYLKVAHIFRKTCQHSHKHLSGLIAPVDVDSGEQQKIKEYSIQELEFEFDPKAVKAEIENEMILDISNEFGDETTKSLPEVREIKTFATTDFTKSTDSKAVNQQIISHVEETDVKNLELGVKLKEEIGENKMISEVFDGFEEGAEEFIKENVNETVSENYYKELKVNENEMILDNALVCEESNLIEESKTDKADCFGELENEILSEKRDDEYESHTRKSSSSHKVRGKYKKRKSDKSFNCDVCGLSFARNQHCMQHMKIHKNECKTCGRTFVSYKNLKKHHCTRFEVYNCDICGNTFAQKGGLARHVRAHTGERPFKCSYCPKDFICSGARLAHLRIHTNERPYTCDICGKSFVQNSTWKRHLIEVHNMIDTNSNRETYKCEFCERTFVHNSYLKRHMRTHKGPRPYKCSDCPKAFSYDAVLKRHLSTHNDEESTSTCDICGISFATNLLEEHKMTVHGISEKTKD